MMRQTGMVKRIVTLCLAAVTVVVVLAHWNVASAERRPVWPPSDGAMSLGRLR